MKQSLAIYRRLMGYTRPYLRGFGLAMVGMVVAAATEPVFPALMKPLLDRGFVDKSGIELWCARSPCLSTAICARVPRAPPTPRSPEGPVRAEAGRREGRPRFAVVRINLP